MPENNPAGDNDWTRTPRIGTDFDSMYFEDVETGDLIWRMNVNTENNYCYRKTGNTTAMNLKLQREAVFDPKATVFQKT